MDKKTKNIIAIIIIGVLIICLAFTIKDRDNDYIVSENIPSINTGRASRRNNYHFDFPRDDDRWATKEDSSKSEEKTTEEKKDDTKEDQILDTKEDKSCNCGANRSYMEDNRNDMFSDMDRIAVTGPVVNSDNSLRVWLIAIETFLLGGTVMFLILNNIEKDTKVSQTKNKTK